MSGPIGAASGGLPAGEVVEGPELVAIVGDSGSGKSTVADAVATLLGPDRVTPIYLDDYRRYTREERRERGLTALDPSGHDFPLMQEHLQLLRQGRPIRNRSYNHANGTFGQIRAIVPREIVLVRGLLAYATDELRALYHLTVFLQPEPDLLFRWKLRRDVQSRGYTEAEVLKKIAQHLLDSKEYVLPQAERADVLVRYELPAWEAADDEIRTSVRLRGEAARVARETDLIAGLGPGARQVEVEGDVLIELSHALTQAEADAWAREAFPESYVAGRIGGYIDDEGGTPTRPPLAVVEVLVAKLVGALR